MPEVAESLPVKRGPGRPRKVAAPKVDAQPDDAWKTSPPAPSIPSDERVGERVDVPGCTGYTFPDDREYRVENGVIVERIR
jgi:hypothetical protein